MIEGEFRVLSEDGVPVEPRPRQAKWRRYAARVPFIVWVWVFAITLVGLTEGLW